MCRAVPMAAVRCVPGCTAGPLLWQLELQQELDRQLELQQEQQQELELQQDQQRELELQQELGRDPGSSQTYVFMY